MATVESAVFSVIWPTLYSAPLDSGSGFALTSEDYTKLFESLPADLALPWTDAYAQGHWSRFWSSYLRNPKRMKPGGLESDFARDVLIPFSWRHGATIVAPAGAFADAEILLYPGGAVVVAIHVQASGPWTLGKTAAAVAGLRSARTWGLLTEPATAADRSLDGIAGDLRDAAVAAFAPASAAGPSTPGSPVTVAALPQVKGRKTELALTKPTVGSCLAGLASLGPPGTFAEDRLLEANHSSKWPARVYLLADGHAIWYPEMMVDRPDHDPVGCLQKNHADLAAHLGALGCLVSWAADHVALRSQVPIATQPLIRLACARLRDFHAGAKTRTYRSGVAHARIEPLLPTLTTVEAAL